DPEVARLALEVINRRLPDAGTELAIELFPHSSATEKRSLLWNLKQKHSALPAASVGILRQAARDSDRGIRDDALEILCDQAYHSLEAWKALNDVKGTITDPAWRERIGRQLADSVQKSNPDMARQFVFAAIRGASADDRRAAAHKVFRLGLPADALLPEVAALVTTYGSDGKFFEALLRGFTEQGMSRLKNVEATELEQILNKAVNHPDKMVKYFGYSLMYSAWSKGAKKFAEPLKFGLTRESDVWLKGQIKNKVDAIERSENPESAAEGD
ncbi:MAG TPA: hypothetical protein PKO06_14145, partial [Candidatus Ozemobacteraceae bacterium]|nr:hypothetical protein [Candidatus Ozemobacteraceae bacterium]